MFERSYFWAYFGSIDILNKRNSKLNFTKGDSVNSNPYFDTTRPARNSRNEA
jgi:hypothetical protein